MRHLMVAIDGSACSQRAAQTAAGLAAQLGGRVTLAFAVPPQLALDEAAMLDLAKIDEAQTRGAREVLDRTAAAVATAGLEIKTVLLHGPAPEALNDAAERLAADLLVVGSRGRSALTRAILGSVAHALVETSKKPVLVVH